MAQDLTTAGGSASFVKTDVTSEVQVKACVTEAVKKYGAIDILVNIACIMTLVSLTSGTFSINTVSSVIMAAARMASAAFFAPPISTSPTNGFPPLIAYCSIYVYLPFFQEKTQTLKYSIPDFGGL